MKDGGPIPDLPPPTSAELPPELDVDSPVVLRGRAQQWLASAWTPQAIADANPTMLLPLWALAGDEPLPVGRFDVPIQHYVDYVLGGTADPLHDVAQQRQGPAVCDRSDLHYYSGSIPFADLSAASRSFLRLDVLPHLEPDGRGRDTVENLWFGPSRGAVGLHWDGRLGFVIQLDGTKRVKVFHPDDRQWLYPEPNWDGPNSRVNPDAIDSEQFPRARHAEFRSATLDPGDVLVIPAGWWHHLTSSTPHATSVNVWLTVE